MNLAEHLLGCAERDASTGKALDSIRHLAGGLAKLGVRPGDRVACALRNRTETIELYWASQWIGAVFTPLNWRLRADEIAYCVADAEAAVLAVEGVSHELAPPGMPVIAVADAGTGTTLEELRAAPPIDDPSSLDERQPALMLYTSGTTGKPKGVPRSHRAERAAAIAQCVQLQLRPGDRTLGVMPLYHTMGMRSLVAASVLGGAFCVQPEFDPHKALELIERERLTSLYLAPTLFHDLVRAHAERPRDVSSVRSLGYAGAPMTGVLVELCSAVFDLEVFVNHYGSTEVYTYTTHGDQRAKPGCAGRPGINSRIRLVEPSEEAAPDQLVPAGAVGQVICHLSSDEAFAGYWRRPDADARQLRGGWFYTGDLGRLDADGDVFLVGRMDDMVISGGENVHPLEIEDWLVRHEGVVEAAVIGAPDERFGERVVACIVGRAGLTAGELDAHCLSSPTLARFKRPREYRFVDELPKSASGKVLRRLLRTTTEDRP